jgi:hypothetical protein
MSGKANSELSSISNHMLPVNMALVNHCTYNVLGRCEVRNSSAAPEAHHARRPSFIAQRNTAHQQHPPAIDFGTSKQPRAACVLRHRTDCSKWPVDRSARNKYHTDRLLSRNGRPTGFRQDVYTRAMGAMLVYFAAKQNCVTALKFGKIRPLMQTTLRMWGCFYSF